MSSGSAVFFGGSLVAAIMAGAIALFAPCCVSVMLPAYLASSFHNRRLLVAMTFLFAAGVATIILPIALGAQALRRVITGEHTTVYLVGGLVMIGLGIYVLLGGQLHIPTPGRRAGSSSGALGVYSLGVFSGIATSCCAPVLAGVIALSGVASSFGFALGLGLGYVFGMVAPLFAISLLWERRDWRSSRLFRPRSFTWRAGPLERTISGTALASSILLVLMGIGMAWVGLTKSSMPSPSGWSARLSARLQHYGHIAVTHLSWFPGWAAAVALAIAVGWLGRRAFRQVNRSTGPASRPPRRRSRCMSAKTAKKSSKSRPAKGRRPAPKRGGARRGGNTMAFVIAGAVIALAGVYVLNRPHGGHTAGSYAFQVGSPGPGEPAPPIRLPSTTGGEFDLSAMKGQTVLLYFQEGLTCQPCWDQLVDIDHSLSRFKAMGIDQVVTITTDPIGDLQQKATDEGLTTPVLSDPNLQVSADYHANSYGMMGQSRDGHSFILVGPDGTIRWRADYGGPPDFTMFLPVDALLGDIRQGLQGSAS